MSHNVDKALREGNGSNFLSVFHVHSDGNAAHLDLWVRTVGSLCKNELRRGVSMYRPLQPAAATLTAKWPVVIFSSSQSKFDEESAKSPGSDFGSSHFRLLDR